MLPPFCPRCGRTVADGGLCSRCRGQTMALDGRRSPFRFEGAVRAAIISFKYRGVRALAPHLAALLDAYLAGNALPAEVLVPVPLHERRLRERGYNQSALLARELGRLAHLPVAGDALVRRHHSGQQARARDLAERYRNVAGAFVGSGAGVVGRKVLLIDDVSTSGATLDACAAALKAAGAEGVWGLVLALEM